MRVRRGAGGATCNTSGRCSRRLGSMRDNGRGLPSGSGDVPGASSFHGRRRCMPWDKERRCCSAILLPQPLWHPPPKPAASRFAIAFRYWSDSFTARRDGIRSADVGSPFWLVVRLTDWRVGGDSHGWCCVGYASNQGCAMGEVRMDEPSFTRIYHLQVIESTRDRSHAASSAATFLRLCLLVRQATSCPSPTN